MESTLVGNADALPSRLVRLHKVSSVAFAEKAFELYQQGQAFVIDNPGGPSDQLPLELEDFRPSEGGGWVTLPAVTNQHSNPAQVIFSSGTQGQPKALVVSYRALANVVQRLNRAMAVDASIREYVGVPVTYSFGLGRLRAVAAVGGSAYLPAQGFDIGELVGLLESDQINAVSAVPTLWRIVLDNAKKFAGVAHKVRWIEIGSQYMGAEEKVRLRELFVNARIVQHYGLTEASRTTLLAVDRAPESMLESVGAIEDGVEVKLDGDGRIMIRGDHLATGVVVDGQMRSITDADGWLVTADLGEIQSGVLHYRGRADDIINCSGVKIDPDVLQQRMIQASGRDDFAVCAVPHELRGQGVFVATLAAHASGQHEILRSAADQCLQAMGLQAADAIVVDEVAAIPKTATGKVQRKALAQSYRPEQATHTPVANDVLALFQSYFGQTVAPSDTFKSLGGDSLRYVQVGSKLEDLIGLPPKGWEGLTVAQLAALEPSAPPKVERVEITVFLRAVAIMAVVVIHAGVEALFGATTLLFLLVGYNFARFQTDALIASRRWRKIGTFVGVTLIPYYGFAALFMLANKELNVPLLLLYENFVGNELTLIFPFWFVQQLTQCLLLFGVLFSLPVSRNWLSNHIQILSMAGCVLIVSATLIFQIVMQPVSPLSGWPIASYLAVFTVGWSLFHAPSLVWRMAVGAMGILVAAVAYGWHTKTAWMALGCVSLVFVTSVYTTAALRRFVEAVSASTLYLFVTNGFVIYVLMKIVGEKPLILASAALMVGVGSWYLYERSGLKHKFVI